MQNKNLTDIVQEESLKPNKPRKPGMIKKGIIIGLICFSAYNISVSTMYAIAFVNQKKYVANYIKALDAKDIEAREYWAKAIMYKEKQDKFMNLANTWNIFYQLCKL